MSPVCLLKRILDPGSSLRGHRRPVSAHPLPSRWPAMPPGVHHMIPVLKMQSRSGFKRRTRSRFFFVKLIHGCFHQIGNFLLPGHCQCIRESAPDYGLHQPRFRSVNQNKRTGPHHTLFTCDPYLFCRDPIRAWKYSGCRVVKSPCQASSVAGVITSSLRNTWYANSTGASPLAVMRLLSVTAGSFT